MSKNLKVSLGIGAVVIAALIAWLAFAVFGVHKIFVDETVNEANPFAVTTEAAAPEANDDPVAAPAAAAEAPDAMTSDAMASETVESDAMESDAAEPDSAESDAMAAETEMTEAAETAAPEPTPAPTTPPVPEIITLAQGSLVNHDHEGVGTITVLTDGTDRFLRFEDDFAVDNGPDLNVYLSRGVSATGDAGLFDDDFIDLGDLKGNIGAQNYQLSPDIDITEYNTLVIWCVRFGVAFNAADLA